MMLSKLEHVWNAPELLKGGGQEGAHFLLWESESRSGGDLLYIGRVTEPVGNGT